MLNQIDKAPTTTIDFFHQELVGKKSDLSQFLSIT